MAKKRSKSQFGTLDTRDFWKGLYTAAFTGLTASLLELISTGFTFDKETLVFLLVGVISGISGYLTNSTFTNSENIPFTFEKVKNGDVESMVQKNLKKILRKK